MKGKRYTTETKIRILREAQSSDKTIQDVCRERQISEQSYWSDPVLCTNCHERFGSGFSLPLFGVGRGVAPTGTEQWAAYTLGLFPPNDECGRFSL